MANSQHQREVADLRAAGLNPILSATGGSGAASPGGASANMQNPFEGFESGLQSAGQMAWKDPLQRAEVEKVRAEADLTRQKEKESEEVISNLKWDSTHKDSLIRLNRFQELVAQANARNLDQDYRIKLLKGDLGEEGRDYLHKGKKLLEDAKGINPVEVLQGAGITIGDKVKDYFGKAYDFIHNYERRPKASPPGTSTGEGRPNHYGGQHKAKDWPYSPGQKVPWSEVEKRKGSEDHPPWGRGGGR